MDELGAAITAIGAAFACISAIGLHRFPDVFARMHAAGKASTLGLGLILLGVAIRLGDLGATAKLALAAVVAVIAVPAGVHLIGRAAHRSGTELSSDTVIDEAGDRSRRRSPAED